MTSATTPDVSRFLTPPRLAKSSPVAIVHLRAPSDPSGNPRRAFLVLTPDGRTVDIIDEGYAGEAQIHARYPWFSHTLAARLGLRPAYAVGIDVPYSVWKGRTRAGVDVDSVSAVRARRSADRFERWHAVEDALQRVRSDGQGIDHEGAERSAVVYHREYPHGGADHVGEHLARAMRALVAAGMVDRTWDKPKVCGGYRATDHTPGPFGTGARA